MYQEELKEVLFIGKEAQKVIMNYYNHGFHVVNKSDNSPVTEADKESDALIRKHLSNKFPSYGFLTEEGEDDKSRLEMEYVWIIDPLDGTKDFVNKDGDFTINIALCKNHEIVLGAVFVPVRNIIYYAIKDEGAYKILENGEIIKINVSNKVNNLTCLTSVFHLGKNEEETIEKHSDKITNVIKAGSSYKACLIAEGKAEISYRLNPGTKEWDTAAFDIVVHEAGGLVIKLDKTKMKYNREDVRNLEGYIIINRIENFLI